MITTTEQSLVGAEECLKIVWPCESSRPCKRTFDNWKADRLIPYVKIGRRIYFDPVEVRHAINKQFRVEVKS
mgnify:CR=1 FL=1